MAGVHGPVVREPLVQRSRIYILKVYGTLLIIPIIYKDVPNNEGQSFEISLKDQKLRPIQIFIF